MTWSWDRLKIALVGGIIFAQLIPFASARAADQPDLSLATSPLPVDVKAAPGTTVSTDLRVKNDGTKTEKLTVHLLKFSARGEDGSPALADREPGDDYFDWVTFSPSTFIAPPGQWMTVKMTIKVPKSAAFGYYLAAAFSRADTSGSPDVKGSKAVVIGSTATLVLLEVTSPYTKRALEALGFSTDRKFYEFLPATFTVRLKNSGNIHVSPAGTIFISRGKSKAGSVDVNANHGNVLPSTIRAFTAQWTDGFPVYVQKQKDGQAVTTKDGKPVMQLKWDFSQVPKLRIGHYTAQILMAYNDGQRDIPLEGSVDFWVIPWRILIVVLIIAVSLLFNLRSIIRRSWARLRKKN